MTEPDPELTRLRPLFVLEKLSARLRSDVLADGSVAGRFDLSVQRPAHLTENIVVARDELFAAFRAVSSQPSVHPLHDMDDKLVEVTLSLNPDGSATVEVGAAKVRFPWASLLAADPAARLSHLEGFLENYPLSMQSAEDARALAASPNYGEENFLKLVLLLESSPEAFAERLHDRLRREGHEHRIGPLDVLPTDARHWDHLFGPPRDSVTLSQFIEHELHDAWRARLDQNPVRAVHSMATTFAAPGLVPYDLLRGLEPDQAVAALEAVSKVEDHFSVAGAFEFCADRVNQNERFIALGDQLLDRLFGDMQRLTSACALFGAIFVIGTGFLAEHEVLRRRPVYWRRLAAAAHAALVVRVCGASGINPDDIFAWGMRVSGEAYFLSVVSDFSVEPQWRPEWIRSNILVADVFGRAIAACYRLDDEAAPVSWRERIQKVQAWINQEKIAPFAHYPAVLEGTRRAQRPTLAGLREGGLDQIAEAFLHFENNPSLNGLLSISPLIEAFGFPEEVLEGAFKALALIRAMPPEDQTGVVIALSVLVHVAILTSNVPLADGVAEACLERARLMETSGPIFEIVARLVECSTVTLDRAQAQQTLARRLEVLTFLLPATGPMAHLVLALETLKRVQPDLGPVLGKALATARLGVPRSIAA